MRVDRGCGRDLAGGIDHGDLHAGAEARIEAHGRARSGRRGEQQVAQIAREHAHGLVLRRLPEPHAQIDREMDLHARPPGPAHGVVEPFVGGPAAIHDVELAGDALLVHRWPAGGCLRGVFRLEVQVEHAFLLAAEHRQDAVRGHFRKRLGEVEIIGEFRALGLLLFLHLRREPAAPPHLLAQIADQIRVFGEALDQDRARAFERGAGIGHALLRVDEGGRQRIGHLRRVGQQRQRQRLQAGLPGDLRLGAALRLVGQVDVLQPRLRIRRHDPRFERVVELALLADAVEDRGAALLHLAQVAQPLLQRAQLRVVEHAGGFLAVARDERHRRAAVQKLNCRLDLRRPHAKLFRNPLFDGFHLCRSALWGRRLGQRESCHHTGHARGDSNAARGCCGKAATGSRFNHC